eukprot:m.169367 g.169367  ORF g.169367 m.169367 type:complete len:52 (+) comp14493_c0_seq1:3869-4024(+)
MDETNTPSTKGLGSSFFLIFQSWHEPFLVYHDLLDTLLILSLLLSMFCVLV